MRHNFTAAADDELAEIVGASDNTAGHLLHPMEGRNFVSEMIRRCDEIDPELGTFSRAWLERVYFDGDDAPNERELAKELGMTKLKVVGLITRVRDIARQTLLETVDITANDVRDNRIPA